MKKIILIISAVLLFACNGDNVPNCFQNAGSIVEKEFQLETFSKITVFERIELILIEGPVQKILVQTGEYLSNDIDVKVEGGRLLLTNKNACNITRDYGLTKVFVTSPNITEIRNSSGLTVSNVGTLNYPDISLISEDFEEEDIYHTDGHFKLNINSLKLRVVVNNLSHMFIKGKVDFLSVNVFSGDARFECDQLIANKIEISHRGTNDLILHPVESIKGLIRSTGDVIIVNEPPIIDVHEIYTGRLIIRN